MMSQRVVFLDRDGVVNRDSPDYIKSVDELRLLPGTARAIKLLKDHGFSVMLITNQSIINRGMVGPGTLSEIHQAVLKRVARGGGAIDDIFFCPHRPEDKCPCRKPRPGMFLAAREKHGMNLAEAVMVGDNVKDMLAANRAGVGTAVLVRTGSGRDAEAEYGEKGARVDHVADTLLEAAQWIVENSKKG